tara:strand:- start:64 stop:423 length:360 start_codon:yes stop_codon:yes gene_type:complete
LIIELKKLQSRGRLRKFRHGNWRQIYVDCNGICQFPECSVIDGLEFHEFFGEVKTDGEHKFQQRVLLCTDHHAEVEGRNVQDMILNHYYRSMVAEDITLEIYLAGSYKKWLERYNLNEV